MAQHDETRESAALCRSCDAMVINGVFCHETGCPDAPKSKTCFECGYEFTSRSADRVCEDCREGSDDE